ncbi:chaperonin 10-like protein [Phellopilus nigrolimitatus]|nr:chaperonin 10-like protein [Phellopilus nigrolimitatus]
MASASSLPKSYKAISCPGPNQGWNTIDVPVREPNEREVFIKVNASGICGSDHFVQDGTWPVEYPRTPGHEVIGRIVALGRGIDFTGRLKVGALVGVGWSGGFCNNCGPCRLGDFSGCITGQFSGFSFDGGHGEYMYAPETAVVSIPEEALENARVEELAPLLCAGTTVYGAIRSSNWQPGDICLVQGIGGLGHLAIQYAAKLGLKVYAVSSGSSKADLAKSLGAHAHVDVTATDVVAYFKALGGAKLIICTAPYAKQISTILPAVARNGTITLVSAATDGNIEVSNLLLNLNRATLRGWSCGGGYESDECIRFSTLADIKSMVKTFSLEQFTEAYDDLINGRPQFRNVIVFKD